MTVAQNLFIGREPRRMLPFWLDERALNAQAKAILQSLHLAIEPQTKVADLTVAKQQMVEIAKALSYNSEVLIMDEPTAALTESEIDELFRMIDGLRAKGVGIVYISHRLEELKRICDRITVMRDGRYVDTVLASETTIDRIISMMVGRTIDESAPDIPSGVEQPVVLEDYYAHWDRWFSNRIYPSKEGITILFNDITERKRAEDQIKMLLSEKELLLKEVHHRIKNNMTLITSLLSLQASSMTDERAIGALKDAESRVRAMVDIYDKLYRDTDYRAIGLQSYFTSLLNDLSRHYTTSARIRMDHDVDDALLDTRIVFPLGIIITELVTNALKYAFPGDRQGVIEVQLKVDGGTLRLRVADDGIGMESELLDHHAHGFGMQLVGLLAQQISAETAVVAHNGTVFTLTAPMPESAIVAS